MKSQFHTFTVAARRRMVMSPAVRKQYIAEHGEGSDYETTNYTFTARIYKYDGEFIVDTQYGYENHTVKRTEQFDSAFPGTKYEIMYQVLPKEGDIIVDPKSGRKFVLGKDTEGFISYKFPMIENGKIVAYMKAEEYYKD